MRKTVRSPPSPVRAGDRARPYASAGLYTPSGQRKYLTPPERRRFMAAAAAQPPPLRTFCLMLAHTGCRLSEALALRAGDIEPASVAIRCLKKRGRLVIRQVPVPPGFTAALRRAHREGFRADLGAPLWPWHRTRAWQLVKAVMAAAGLRHPAATPKGLRHAFGVHAVLSGVPLTLVQKWLGHEDIATTAIYTAVIGREELAIARRMWR